MFQIVAHATASASSKRWEASAGAKNTLCENAPKLEIMCSHLFVVSFCPFMVFSVLCPNPPVSLFSKHGVGADAGAAWPCWGKRFCGDGGSHGGIQDLGSKFLLWWKTDLKGGAECAVSPR